MRNGYIAPCITGRRKRTAAVRCASKRCKQKRASKKSWNPHAYLVSAARKVWRWCPEKKEASRKAEDATGENRRCAKCGKMFPRKMTQMDHIVAVGKQPTTWEQYPDYYRRLFCPVTNIQCLCKPCHTGKTKTDIKGMQ